MPVPPPEIVLKRREVVAPGPPIDAGRGFRQLEGSVGNVFVGRLWPRDDLQKMVDRDVTFLLSAAPEWVKKATDGDVLGYARAMQAQWKRAIDEYDRRTAAGEAVELYDTMSEPMVMRVGPVSLQKVTRQ
jgi:hypothetical protein